MPTSVRLRKKARPANYYRGKFPDQLSPIIRQLTLRFRFFSSSRCTAVQAREILRY